MALSQTPRLGVNIDHVATLRQARGEAYPSVVEAARVALAHGADQITLHLREDRRHIQDADVAAVQAVTRQFERPLNFEMGCHPGILDMALTVRPNWVCLVPENRRERTTEGGLDLLCSETFEKVRRTCQKLKDNDLGVRISLFVECREEILQRCAQLAADAVEIHTGDFARAHLCAQDSGPYLRQYCQGHRLCHSLGLGFHAGHGLTFDSTVELLRQKLFAEYNIGHWIICQAVFDGLGAVVAKLKSEFERHPVPRLGHGGKG